MDSFSLQKIQVGSLTSLRLAKLSLVKSIIGQEVVFPVCSVQK